MDTVGAGQTAQPWSLYLFDPEDSRWRRPWAEMLPAGFQEVRIEDSRFVRAEGEARHGVVVVHASQLPDQRSQTRLFGNCRQAGLHLVLISGGHQSAARVPGVGYRRCRPVRVRRKDDEFRECFARFWAHLQETGDCCFELLEPSRSMVEVLTLLCQGYMLAHLNAQEFKMDLPGCKEEWKERTMEALNRLGVGAAVGGKEYSEADLDFRPAGMPGLVSSGTWWEVVEVTVLRREMSVRKIDEGKVDSLVREIETGEGVSPAAVLDAYEILEDHLRSNADGPRGGD